MSPDDRFWEGKGLRGWCGVVEVSCWELRFGGLGERGPKRSDGKSTFGELAVTLIEG
jgi:hypothetical protein